ncbi:MAG: OmpA family protein, partial [Treponema sp.]|nr:OmpA family protein [Treponema sp.]
RAQAVIEALKQDGIDGKLFSYKGFGGTKPVESNNTAAGRAKNRRVVIKLLPQNADAQRR